MTYRIERRDGGFIANVNERTLVRGAVPLTLIGRGALDFGEAMNENFINLLENFAHRSPPDAALRGMLWYDTSTEQIKVLGSNGQWKQMAYAANSVSLDGDTMTGDLKIINTTNNTWSNIGADGIITLARPDHKARINFADPDGTILVSFAQDGPDLHVYGGGTLKIDDNAVWHEGNFDPNSKLDVAGGEITGDLTVDGDLTVLGKLTASMGEITGDLTVGGTLFTKALKVDGKDVWTTDNFTPGDYLPISGGTVTGSLVANAGLTVRNGELVASATPANGGQLRLIGGNRAVIQRNDGSTFQLLLTNSGQQNGGANNLRPFTIDLPTGNVTVGTSLTVNGSMTVNTGPVGIVSDVDPTLFIYKPSANWCAGLLMNSGNKFGVATLDGTGHWQSWSRILMELDSAANLVVQGDITAASDARLKSDVRTIENALELVEQLRGVRFSRDGKEGVGVIAQEVQKVVPEVVHDNDGGMMSVAYGNLVGVLIEAVKELSARVAKLEGRA